MIPAFSWIVPTVPGRDEQLERSLAPLEEYAGWVEIIERRGHETCGDAWVEGMSLVDTDYVYFAADDIEPHPGFVEAMIAAVDVECHPAALVLMPDGTVQSCGGQGNDVCKRGCVDWQAVEWSPTPFIHRDWWQYIEPHADMLRTLHYSSDRLVSAALAREGITSVFRSEAVITHYNSPAGRLWTAGADGQRFEEYWRSQ